MKFCFICTVYKNFITFTLVQLYRKELSLWATMSKTNTCFPYLELHNFSVFIFSDIFSDKVFFIYIPLVIKKSWNFKEGKQLQYFLSSLLVLKIRQQQRDW